MKGVIPFMRCGMKPGAVRATHDRENKKGGCADSSFRHILPF